MAGWSEWVGKALGRQNLEANVNAVQAATPGAASSAVDTAAPPQVEAQPAMTLPLHMPPLSIETEVDAAQLARLFAHTESTWTRLGNEEPHWSVLSVERFKHDQIGANLAEFHASGRGDVELLLAFLARNGVDPDRLERVLEYGCGLGRVTRFLADRFPAVQACDISPSHLAQAQHYLTAAGLRNITYQRIASPADVQGPRDIDLFFSVIVLQHNPPPTIVATLKTMLSRLRAGGIAYFQVPTYATGYSFDLNDYLARGLESEHVEMHCVPQQRVFQVAAEAGCDVLEVREDDWVGRRHLELSNTFLLRRR